MNYNLFQGVKLKKYKEEKVNMKDKILVTDSKFLECVDEVATQITEMNFGAETWVEADYNNVMIFSEEAQDFYNEKFDEYEDLINITLNVWNKQREI